MGSEASPAAGYKGRIGERLITAGHITEAQLEEALHYKRKNGGFLGDVLVKLGYVSVDVVGQMLADTIGASYIRLDTVSIDPTAVALIPEEYQCEHGVLPYKRDGDSLYVAMSDPLDVVIIDDLTLSTGMRVVPALALSVQIQAAFVHVHKVKMSSQNVLREIQDSQEGDAAAMPVDRLMDLASDAPIVRLVNSIMSDAVKYKASDIHIEPRDKDVRVRYRIDGILYEQMTFPFQYLPAVVSRIKIMAKLNIAETRRPQDGRLTFGSHGRDFDMRISTMQMAHGEKVVIRILDKSGTSVSLQHLGFLPEQLQLWSSFLDRPHGIILVCGPTGSGKSTTLYASLMKINDVDRNIITIEDPIEYNIPGINQSNVNAHIGVTFANGLRAIVRQDPDVIMVGEIRDTETAEVAVQAALTGHLVFSTLHTNDAPGALVRLQNMEVESFLLTSSIVGVVGQRLLRKNCVSCSESVTPDPGLLMSLGVDYRILTKADFRRGKGCSACSGRGYMGRIAVYEVMPMSDGLREGVLRQMGTPQLKEIAVSDGMMTMREAGLHRALDGETTLEEVSRVLMGQEATDTTLKLALAA
jgi:type IV pilus assembly protein PilB